MWAGQGGWGSWPIVQSAFANVPSEEVDWASLAKQWIAQREVMGMTSTPHAEPQYLAPPQRVAPPPPPPLPATVELDRPDVDQPAVGANTVRPQQAQSMPIVDAESGNSQDSNFGGGSIVPQGGWDKWNSGGWGMQNWAVPPPPPPEEATDDSNMAEGQFQSSEPFVNSFGYGQGMNEYYQQPFDNNVGGCDFSYWSEQQMPPSAMIPHHLGGGPSSIEYRPAPRRSGFGAHGPMAPVCPPLMDDSGLDAAKRRHLPAWIREGLEKMEREKQRQMEKEKEQQDALNAKLAQEAAEREAMQEINQEKGQQRLTGPVKSRFDSDNEGDSDSDTDKSGGDSRLSAQKMNSKHLSPPKQVLPDVQAAEEEEPFVSEEEKQARIMIRVRQMLTEVLLDVTNREIADIAHSVFQSAKTKEAKAPAKQLAKSTALASITSLGLGYGSDSDEEDNAVRDDASSGQDSDGSRSSSDEEVHERIRRKKLEFERKMRDLEELEQRELEQKQRDDRQQQVKKEDVKHKAVNSSETKVENHDTADERLASDDDDDNNPKVTSRTSVHASQDVRKGHSSKSHKVSSRPESDPVKSDSEERTESKRTGEVKVKKTNNNKQASSSSGKSKRAAQESETDSDSSSSSESSSGDSSSEEDESQSTNDSDRKKSRHKAKREHNKSSGREKVSRRESEVSRSRSSKKPHTSRQRVRASRDDRASNDDDEERQDHKESRSSRKDHKRKEREREKRYEESPGDSHRRHSKEDRKTRRVEEDIEDRPHRHKRTSDTGYSDDRRTSGSLSVKSSRKKSRRSHSSSQSSDSRSQSRRHRRSSPSHKHASKRQRHSSPGHTEKQLDRSGKASRAKHKSRSVSRSSYED